MSMVQQIIQAVNKSAGRILYQFTEEEIDFLCKYAPQLSYHGK